MSEAKPAPSQQSALERDLVAQPSSTSSEGIQGELWPVAELVALERERIASQDRRADIARHAIDAGDAADKRQYEYHVEKLRRDDGGSQASARIWNQDRVGSVRRGDGSRRVPVLDAFRRRRRSTGGSERAAGDHRHRTRRIRGWLGAPERHPPLAVKTTMTPAGGLAGTTVRLRASPARRRSC